MSISRGLFSFLRYPFQWGGGNIHVKRKNRKPSKPAKMLTLFFASVLIFFAVQDAESKSSSAAVISGRGCDLFTDSFAKGTRFIIIDWAGRSKGAALLEPGQALYEITGQQISYATDEQKATATVKFHGETLNRETADLEDAEKSRRVLTFKTAVISKAQMDGLFSQFQENGAHAGWLVVRDAEKKNLYRLDLTASETLHRSLFDAGFVELKYNKGTIIKFKALDKENRTVTIFPHSAGEKPFLRFRNFLNLEYKLPFNMTLTQVPQNLLKGSLRVADSVRAVERTSIKVNLKHSNKPFGSMVFRGCLGSKKSGDGSFTWTEIPNFSTLSASAGSAQLEFDIPTLQGEVSPGFYDTLSNIFFGGKDNSRILVMAATDAGIQFAGETELFSDNRRPAFLTCLISLVFAYWLPFAFLRPKDDVKTIKPPATNRWYSLLNLVRGRNGTASLSNLQIWWWTIAVFSLLFYVWVGTGTLASLNATIMWLLGVTSGGSIAAKLVASRLNAAEQSVVAALAGHTVIKTTALDLIKVGDHVSPTKLQMLLFTIITGVYVVTSVWSQLVFPEISTEMLTLMGISNGVYVLGKINNSNPHIERATLMVRLETLAEQETALKASRAEPKQKGEKKSGQTDDMIKKIEAAKAAIKARITEIDATEK